MTHDDVGDHARDDTATAASGRRALIGAGLIGALFAISGGQRASAAASPATGAPTGTDADLLEFAMRLELSARDLYDAAIESGGLVGVATAMREQHEAYAQGLAAFTGLSARGRNDDVYDALQADFAVANDEQVAGAAYDLESIAAATHTELIRLVERTDIASLLGSIAVVESRHCAVLADAAGLGDDLDALLVNDADPQLPEDLS